MAREKCQARDVSRLEVRASLRAALNEVLERCINCRLCQKECAFLRKYGKPKEIADRYDPSDLAYQGMPFECSLCQLCHAVCPVGAKPADMFLQMRCESVDRGNGSFAEHGGLLAYEKRGTSKRYSYYGLPQGCDTVFFPGCTLPGTRPDKTYALYQELKSRIPSLGVVLDCCTKISHDLGRESIFRAMFEEMKSYLLEKGVQHVLVACPNCHKVFSNYGGKLQVRTVYEILAENSAHPDRRLSGVVRIHDPCTVRFEDKVHAALRKLVRKKGLEIEEMVHSGKKTLCCGEGGAVGYLAPAFSEKWGEIRKTEAEQDKIITCCAGCAGYLNRKTPTSHVLDLLYEPEAAMAGKAKVSTAPITYLNRLRLKKRFQQDVKSEVIRERSFWAGQATKKSGKFIRLTVLSLIVAAIVAIRVTGATKYLDQETLRGMIAGYGALAPIIYMVIYTAAPALFNPGLPITLVGGILFGPFWGLVYSICGSTVGACLAFFISRYLARRWISGKLRSPRWRKLDEAVERHGWKVVAFTRLIPAFPFNLLNYAFGLSMIKFAQYAVTTFFCMLPGCIAFIVFSSSLLDVIRGRISGGFLLGVGMIVLLSVVPLLYRRYKTKKGTENFI
jgi:uncharacterized membrane protein YdjX (TVP38/TMEM64 family)/Fe-S oxidoreductase